MVSEYNKAKVAVIVPAYNVENTLRRCVYSICTQSFKDIEVIIVDDGSPDRSGEIADSLAAQDRRIVVVHKKNGGLAEARRSGIEKSKADYIMHVDSDDELEEGAIEFLYKKCVDNDLDFVFGSYTRINGNKLFSVLNPSIGIMSGKDLLCQMLTLDAICVTSWGSLSKRDLWRKEIFPPEDVVLPSEDVLISVRMTRYIKKAGIFNHSVYRYYYNPSSLSITNRLSTQSLWQQWFEMLRGDLMERGLADEFEQKVRIMEIDRIGFYVNPVDCSSPWLVRVLGYDLSGFPVKTKILRWLIKRPKLRMEMIQLNRRVKRLFGFVR